MDEFLKMSKIQKNENMGELGTHSNGDTELQASMAAFFFFFLFPHFLLLLLLLLPLFLLLLFLLSRALTTLIMTTVRRGAPHPFLVLLLC